MTSSALSVDLDTVLILPTLAHDTFGDTALSSTITPSPSMIWKVYLNRNVTPWHPLLVLLLEFWIVYPQEKMVSYTFSKVCANSSPLWLGFYMWFPRPDHHIFLTKLNTVESLVLPHVSPKMLCCQELRSTVHASRVAFHVYLHLACALSLVAAIQ